MPGADPSASAAVREWLDRESFVVPVAPCFHDLLHSFALGVTARDAPESVGSFLFTDKRLWFVSVAPEAVEGIGISHGSPRAENGEWV